MSLSIRAATIEDVSALVAMVREFAEFEHLETSVTEADLARDGFGPAPKFRAILAERDGAAAGYALFFEFYSSFGGHAGMFLEDLYVRAQFRRRGIGKALFGHVAALALKEGCSSLRWNVLDWNSPAIEFYRGLGASFADEWRSVSLSGAALESVAAQGRNAR